MAVADSLGARRFVRLAGPKGIAVRGLTPGSCTVQVWTGDGCFKKATAVAGREKATTLRLDKR